MTVYCVRPVMTRFKGAIYKMWFFFSLYIYKNIFLGAGILSYVFSLQFVNKESGKLFYKCSHYFIITKYHYMISQVPIYPPKKRHHHYHLLLYKDLGN